jgi:hypothetical protein
MDRFTRRAKHAFYFVLILFALLLGMSIWNTAHAQGVLPASTGCIGDSVVTMFRADVQMDSLSRQELEAHESVHRAQMAEAMKDSTVSCYAAMMRFTVNPLANLMTEVPAYRAQGEWLRVHRSASYDPDVFFEWVAKGLYGAYGGAKGKLPYSFILEYLTTGVMPKVAGEDFPPASIAAARDLLDNHR